MLANSKQQREWIVAAMDASGIKRNRVQFFSRMSPPDYFLALGMCDIVLDTFPCTGGTTVCDPLWMGTPVVGYATNRLFGVGALSVLHAVGLDDLVARAPDEYVDIAVHLAHSLSKRDKLRANLRMTMTTSSLMEHCRFTRALESGYCIALHMRASDIAFEHICCDAAGNQLVRILGAEQLNGASAPHSLA